jgi:hypothetical protein
MLVATIQVVNERVSRIDLPPSEYTYNEDQVRNRPEVRNWIAKYIKGEPYFESVSAKVWYLVDKLPKDENDEFTSSLTEVFVRRFITSIENELEAIQFTKQGYLDSIITPLSDQDYRQFKRFIHNEDEFDLSVRNKVYNAKITNIEDTNVNNGIKYTLVRL